MCIYIYTYNDIYIYTYVLNECSMMLMFLDVLVQLLLPL